MYLDKNKESIKHLNVSKYFI